MRGFIALFVFFGIVEMLNKNIYGKGASYEEIRREHYLYDNIKDQIYPWVSSTLSLPETLNGKNISGERYTIN